MKRLLHFISILIITSATQIHAQGPVAWYMFNGNARDTSGNGYHGALNEATLTTDRFGETNAAYHFDGINDYVSIDNFPTNFPDVTVAAWILLENIPTTSNNWIFSSAIPPSALNQPFELLLLHQTNPIGNGISFAYQDGSQRYLASGTFPDTLEWAFIVGRRHFNGTSYEVDVFLNGNLAGDTILDGTPPSLLSQTVRIGIQNTALNQGFKGKIDDILIYNRVLSAHEIDSLYHDGIPTVTSFTPTSGPIGTSVTITGTNFNTTASNNVVYFGGVKASVSNATSTSLTVIVPTGATYAPITVTDTTTGLTAYSNSQFVVTFIGPQIIDATSFENHVDFAAGPQPWGVAICDFDGDAKQDLAISIGDSVSVFRNTSTLGIINSSSFAEKVNFATGSFSAGIAIGDIDGDAKPDLAVGNAFSGTVSVFRNISTTGQITTGSFAAKEDFAVGSQPYGVAIGDLDSDGKPDLAVANNVGNTVSILKNTSVPGSITSGSFASLVSFPTGANPVSISIGDLDGDLRPDLLTANNNGTSLSLLRNMGTTGVISTGSFAASVNFTVGSSPISIPIGDLDQDGKPEISTVSFSGNAVSVLKNTSTVGDITSSSFSSKIDFTTGTNPVCVVISDIDGDSKPDLVTTNQGDQTVSIFKNVGSAGQINASSFAAKVDFATGGGTLRDFAIGDIDGDGKPDIVIPNGNGTVSVLRNKIQTILAGEYTTDTNTVLLMHFDESSGSTAYDASGNGNNGTATGTTITTGRFGNARNYDTSVDYITVPNNSSLNFTNQLTLEAWVNFQSGSDLNPRVISKGQQTGYELYLDGLGSATSKRVGFVARNGGADLGLDLLSSTFLVEGNFYHIAFTYDGSNKSIYINGKLDAQVNVSGNLVSSSNNLTIGRIVDNSGGAYKGKIDEVRISKIARDPSEFNLQLPPKNISVNFVGPVANLSWQNGGGAAPLHQYYIYRGTDSTTMSKIDSTASTSKSVTQSAGTYFYRISALDSTGFEGAKSVAVSGTVILPGEYAADTNTVLLMHFDESSGSIAYDASGMANNGTVYTAPIVTGKVSNARQMVNSSADSGVVITNGLSLTEGQAVTLEAWINIDSYTDAAPGFIQTNEYQLIFGSYGSKGLLMFYRKNGSNWTRVASTSQIPVGRWVHIAGTYDGANMKIFVDGKSVQFSMISDAYGAVGRSRIASYLGNVATPTGTYKIDEVRISKIARDPSEFNLQLPPKNISVNSVGSVANLTWQNGGGQAPLQQYYIYRGTDSTTMSKIDSTTSLSKSITQTAGTYYYRISALDSTGFEGAKSVAVSAVSDLVAYYPFTGGSAADSSGNGNNGTNNGATPTTDRFGNANRALDFNGSSSYVVTSPSDFLDTYSAGTLSIWFKTPGSIVDATLYSYSTDGSLSSNFSLYTYQSKIRFGVRNYLTSGKNPYFTGTTTLQPNTWYHLVLTSDGSSQVVAYLNDNLEDLVYTDDASGANGNFWFSTISGVLTYSHFVSIGALRRNGVTETFYSGNIDDILICNRALTATEIDSLYKIGGWGVPPSAPQNLSATRGVNQANLIWQRNTESNFQRYRIFRGTSPNPTVQVDSTSGGNTDTTKVSAGLVNGQTYYFRVAAVNIQGLVSVYSNEVSIIATNDLAPPAAPQLLSATPGNNFVALKWRRNTENDFLRYRVYKGNSPNAATLTDSTVGVLDTAITITGLTNGALHYFRITAVDSAYNLSNFSNELTATPANQSPVRYNLIADQNLDEDFGKILVTKLNDIFSDDGALTYTRNILNGGIDAQVSNDSLYVLSVKDSTGIRDIRIVANDGSLTAVDTFSVTINPVNDAPYLMTALRDTSFGQSAGSAFVYKLSEWFGDVDGPSLTYTVSSITAGLNAARSNDSLFVSNLAGFVGNGNIRVTASDGSLPVSDTFSISVIDNVPPDAPTGLGGTAGNLQATLQWNQNNEGDFKLYRIYWGTSSAPTMQRDSAVGISTLTKLITGISNSTTYFCRIRAVDTLGNISGYSTEITVTTPTPPSITQHTPVNSAQSGQLITINATVEGTNPVVQLYYGMGSDLSPRSIKVMTGTSNYTAAIPADSVTALGLWYKIVASNITGDSSYPRNGDRKNITVKINTADISQIQNQSAFTNGVVPKNDWFAIGIPLYANINLQDVLGTASSLTTWVAYKFNYSMQFLDTLSMWDTISTLRGGQAYLLYHKTGSGGNIFGSVTSANTISIDSFDQVILRPGWNFVAWPYTFAARVWRKTDMDRDSVSRVWELFSSTKWDSTNWFRPFSAYMIENKQTSDLPLRQFITWNLNQTNVLKDNYLWRISFNVESDKQKDRDNYIGISEDYVITESKPLSFGKDVLLGFEKTTEGRKKLLCEDMRLNSADGHVWDMKVLNNSDSKQAKLSWTKEDFPSVDECIMIDISNNATIDLKAVSEYSFRPIKENKFKIIAGDPAFVNSESEKIKSELPTEFALSQNFPNPFNPTTTIRFDVARSGSVRIKIYNILGQEVATLVNGFYETGRNYEAVWNGKDALGRAVSSGVYIYRLEAGKVSKVKKMLLVK